MGWDAHSSAAMNWKQKEPRIKHPDLHKAFTEASDWIIETAKSVDNLLSLGSLDCSSCREMLTEATGKSCYTDWSKEEVQKIANSAYWDFEYSNESAWAYWSARKFLEICAQYKLSISFSY